MNSRLLSILLIITNKGIVTGQELANHFEVSLRTIYRDIDKLSEAGIPIASIGGKGGGYYIMENFNINNLFIDKKEASTIISIINSLKGLFGKNLSFYNGEWFLVAYCRNRNDFRKFKLVRMSNLQLGNEYIKKEITNEELQKIFSDSYDSKSIKVVLKFTNKMGYRITEYFRKENIKETTNEYIIIEDYFPNDEGLIKYILSFGLACEVIEPDFLKKDLKKYLEGIIKNYND